MARTLDLYQLLSQPESYRNLEWERALMVAFSEAKVELSSSEAQSGPDGWPYLHVKASPQAGEPVVRVVDWLSTRGIGMVLNAYKMMPDYIFTYGMIWHFKEKGMFQDFDAKTTSGPVAYKKEAGFLFGPPSEAYLPLYVRKVLRQFLNAQGVKYPKILVATSKDYSQTDLIISVDSLGNPPEREHRAFAEALSWFLPTHYPIVLAQEGGLPPFADL
tara:strand:+ start:2149 stop:2799 length:651 start_codon:yes stop_codon:yes gene_type:complete